MSAHDAKARLGLLRFMKNIWFITRQSYWPEGTKVVEIALGGRDYSNPDALCKKYEGEFEEFDDPREAARVAIGICKAWRRDGAKSAKVAVGFTAGFTMPFEPSTFKDILTWGEGQYEALPKCAQCGELLGEERYGSWELQEFDCCSERCAEKRYYSEPEEIAA